MPISLVKTAAFAVVWTVTTYATEKYLAKREAKLQKTDKPSETDTGKVDAQKNHPKDQNNNSIFK